MVFSFNILFGVVQAFIFIEGGALFDRYNPNNLCLIMGIIATSFVFLGLYRIINLLEDK